MKLRKAEKHWSAFLIICWLTVFSWSKIYSLFPISYWFSVDTFAIKDSAISTGRCSDIHFIYDRTIKRPFSSSWIVTLLKRPIGDTGPFVTYSAYPGSNDYRPINGLPEVVDLCWLIGKDVTLPKGEYQVNIKWTLFIAGTDPKELLKTATGTFVVNE